MISYHGCSDVGEESMVVKNFLNVGEITNIRVNTSTYIFNNILHQRKKTNNKSPVKIRVSNFNASNIYDVNRMIFSSIIFQKGLKSGPKSN